MPDAAALHTPLPTPSAVQNGSESKNGIPSFDIVSTYRSLLDADPFLTIPVAAIEALILLLSHSPPSTISETLSLLSHYTNILKSSVAHPIAVSAGTDLFQRSLISSLQSSQTTNKPRKANSRGGLGNSTDDFQATRNHLISNKQIFVTQAKEARIQIANIAQRFIGEDSIVMTYGSSRVVGAALNAALNAGTVFKLVYVCDSISAASTSISDLPSTIPRPSSDLQVAVIQPLEISHALPQVSMVMLGAEGVFENGGIVSGLGTYQLGILAKAAGKPVYVCAESHKFVRIFPLSQSDVGGKALKFSESGESEERIEWNSNTNQDVDYTPPEMITTLVTESGVHTPSAVSEELIQMWY